MSAFDLHNIDLIMVLTCLLTLFAGTASGLLLFVNRRMQARWRERRAESWGWDVLQRFGSGLIGHLINRPALCSSTAGSPAGLFPAYGARWPAPGLWQDPLM
jgi:hypothetical protein